MKICIFFTFQCLKFIRTTNDSVGVIILLGRSDLNADECNCDSKSQKRFIDLACSAFVAYKLLYKSLCNPHRMLEGERDALAKIDSCYDKQSKTFGFHQISGF